MEQQHSKPKTKKQKMTMVISLITAFLVFCLAIVGLAYYHYTSKLDNQIVRIKDPFSEIDKNKRPSANKEDHKPLNILILGSDSRSSHGDLKRWVKGGQRSDVMMIMQFSAKEQSINVMSIPRDSWVDIPGHGKGKINWAFSFGGAPLAIKTVENLTHIRIDHFALVDFTSFVDLTNALGGVDLTTDTEGTHHYNGEEALAFVRERHHLPNGDFDRGRRHMLWMRAMMKKAKENGMLANLTQINQLINLVSKSVAVDDQLTFANMRDLAAKLYSTPGSNFHFVTMPNLGPAMVGTQSTVTVNNQLLDELGAAWQKDHAADFIIKNRDRLTVLNKGKVY